MRRIGADFRCGIGVPFWGQVGDGVLHIQLLGGFRLLAGDAELPALDAPRQQELIAYLLLHPAPDRHGLRFRGTTCAGEVLPI